MGGFLPTPCNCSGSSGGSSQLGALITYASPAGSSSSVAPSGFPGSSASPVGRLNVTLGSGAATWESLKAGAFDGQLVRLFNADSTNSLQLTAASGSGNAQFQGLGLELDPGDACWLTYDETANLWTVVP